LVSEAIEDEDMKKKDMPREFCRSSSSNASSHYIGRQDLCKLEKSLNLNILMVYYPPYCSNYIEHWLFLQLTRTWQGVPFYNRQFVNEPIQSTSTGLRVYSHINLKDYQIKQQVNDDSKAKLNNQIIFDGKISRWNYLIKPT
jgi:hypothetical protein